MNAVDTNVLIYRLDRSEPVKRRQARALLQKLRADPAETVLLWQVAGEFLRQLRSWEQQGTLGRGSARRFVNSIRFSLALTLPTPAVLDRALDLTDRYSLSHWDSMLVGACLEAGVTTLYTEDM